MYRSEVLFASKFLASLKKLNVTNIPFGNSDFQNGIRCMSEYFQENESDLSRFSDELSLLFLQRPVEGSYDEFSNVLLNLNGRFISFALQNPYYENATIKIDKEDADYLLSDQKLAIEPKHIENFSKAFCEGAGINIRIN